MKLRYFCHYGQLTGYGRAARDYLAALERFASVELQIVPMGHKEPTHSPEPRYRHLDKLVVQHKDELDSLADVTVVHGSPRAVGNLLDDGTPTRWISACPSRRWVAMTTWEVARDDNEFFGNFHAQYDAIIAPARFCCSAIGDTFQGPVYRVPHTLDCDFWGQAYDSRKLHPFADDRAFRFYTIGAPSDRKNTIGVVRAFLHEFKQEDPVELVIAGLPDDTMVNEAIVCSNLGREVPNIRLMATPLSEDGLLALHRNGHCYVSATRGEGWGLGAFEAVAVGNPVVMPEYGGQLDYLDGYPHGSGITYGLTPVVPTPRRERDPKSGREKLVVDAPSYLNAHNMWAEPDLSHLAHLMRLNFAEPARARDGWLVEFRARYDYGPVGKTLLDTLERIAKGERDAV